MNRQFFTDYFSRELVPVPKWFLSWVGTITGFLFTYYVLLPFIGLK